VLMPETCLDFDGKKIWRRVPCLHIGTTTPGTIHHDPWPLSSVPIACSELVTAAVGNL
jgi:hypothetical protein